MAVILSVLRKKWRAKISVTPDIPAAYRRLTADVSVAAPTASGILMPPLAFTAPSNVPPVAVRWPPRIDLPGRASLALDLMEELRSILADRFVLSLINMNIVTADGFTKTDSGAVYMDDTTRKAVLSSWQKKKQETIKHPFLDQKIEWGLVPYVQALLLARTIRGDLPEYPPFLWK